MLWPVRRTRAHTRLPLVLHLALMYHLWPDAGLGLASYSYALGRRWHVSLRLHAPGKATVFSELWQANRRRSHSGPLQSASELAVGISR